MSQKPRRVGAFITLVYRLLLNRIPDRNAFVDAYLALSRDEMDPFDLIQGIVRSDERRQFQREHPSFQPRVAGVVRDFQDGEQVLSRMLGSLRSQAERQATLDYLQGELALAVDEFSLAESFFKRSLASSAWELVGRVRLTYARVRSLGVSDPGAAAAALGRMVEKTGLDEHLTLLHHARLELVRTHLPVRDNVLDLGGIATPLYKLGYPDGWARMRLLDYRSDRERVTTETVVRDEVSAGRDVTIIPGDLSTLKGLDDAMFDLIWAGQCIQAIEPDEIEQFLRNARSRLKRDGILCLDTPNRLITRVHLEGSGKTFVNASHCVEYEPARLQTLLLDAGYRIEQALGVCEMGRTLQLGHFRYDDFLRGDRFTKNVDSAYFQYYRCVPT